MNFKISGFAGFAEWICSLDFIKVTALSLNSGNKKNDWSSNSFVIKNLCRFHVDFILLSSLLISWEVNFMNTNFVQKTKILK